MDDLTNWFKDCCQVEEKAMTRADITKLLKCVHFWNTLPLRELQMECARKLRAPPQLQGTPEAEQRSQMMQVLFEQELMAIWDGRGFQALRNGNFEKVCNIVAQYEQWLGMEDEAL